jgi:hypothetical protein
MSGGVASDQKVRLIPKDLSLLQDGLVSPLMSTMGIVFPYTPTIMVGHSAQYGQYDITQGQYQQQFFVNSPNPSISLTATFTSQTTKELEYTIACLTFLKSCTKSDFGEQRRDTAGTPPPVLLFSAYGLSHFKNVPVVVKSVSYTLPEDVDYVSGNLTISAGKPGSSSVDITLEQHDASAGMTGVEYMPTETNTAGVPAEVNMATMPTQLIVSIELGVQYPPTKVRREFNIQDYRSGKLLNDKGFV